MAGRTGRKPGWKPAGSGCYLIRSAKRDWRDGGDSLSEMARCSLRTADDGGETEVFGASKLCRCFSMEMVYYRVQ